jgi:large subunit ribosomal protein L25
METLIASTRQGLGKEAAKKVRSSQEQIPAVLYGFGVEKSTSLTLDYRTLEKALAGPKKLNASFNVSIDDQPFGKQVLVRELQRHPVSRRIMHVDLVVADPNKAINAVVPLAITGRSPGVQAGGRLRTPYREVTVSCVPSAIPASIDVDISPLHQGDAVMASKVSLPEGVKLVYDRDFIVAKVLIVRAKKK